MFNRTRVSLIFVIAALFAIGACSDGGPADPRPEFQSIGAQTLNVGGEPTEKDMEFLDELRAGAFTVCKVVEGTDMKFEFNTVAEGPGVPTAPIYEPTVMLGNDECADVYEAPSGPDIDPDLVTITEVVPDGWMVERVFIWSLDEIAPGEFETTYHELPAGTTTVQGSIDANKLGCVVIFYNAEVPTGDGCTRTPGYWKTHPEDWPVEEITIGGQTFTKDEAIDLLWEAERGDKSKTLFRALVAAKLNMYSGADVGCVTGEMEAADEWLETHGICTNVRGNSQAWKDGEPLYTTLDDYNNGELCAPHCDDLEDDDRDEPVDPENVRIRR